VRGEGRSGRAELPRPKELETIEFRPVPTRKGAPYIYALLSTGIVYGGLPWTNHLYDSQITTAQ